MDRSLDQKYGIALIKNREKRTQETIINVLFSSGHTQVEK